MRDYKDKDFIDSIISAINEKKLILFIGAGFSRLCGLPLWNELAVSLIDQCVFDKDIGLNFADKELIMKGKDAKTLITIAYYLYCEKNKKDAFYGHLLKYLSNFDLDEDTIKRKNNLVRLVRESGATVLTTNSDDILRECFASEDFIYHDIMDLKRFRINSNRQLLYLHGNKRDVTKMVFTTRDYLERYSKSIFKRCIKQVFNSDYTILFIGYSLSELQLLDFLIDGNYSRKNRFVLEGFFNHEKVDFTVRNHYLSSYGLQLISFSRDENNYLELVNALEYIVNKSKEYSNFLPNSYNEAIHLLNKRPSKGSKGMFINCFLGLDNVKRKKVLFSITKCNYKSAWIVALFKEEDNVSILFGLDPKSKIDLSGYESLISILIEVYRKEKDNRVYLILKDNLLRIISNPRFHAKMKSDKGFSGIILQAVLSDYRLINNKTIFTIFTYRLIESSELDQHISWISVDSIELFKASKSRRLSINGKMISFYVNNDYNSYLLDLYFEQHGLKLSEDFPFDVFKQINSAISTKKSMRDSKYIEVGSVISFLESGNSLRDDVDYILLKWYAHTLKNLDDKSTRSLFVKFYNSETEIEAKLSILLLSMKYQIISDIFLSGERNPFNKWCMYSDLYNLVDLIWDDIGIEDRKKIKEKINAMKIVDISDFYSLVCKMDLLKLIGSKKNDMQSLQQALTIEDQFTIEEKAKYIQFPEPMLRNRRVWITSYTMNVDMDFKNLLFSKSIEDFFGMATKGMTDSQSYTFNSTYYEFFDSNNILEWITSNGYSNIYSLSFDSLKLVVKYLLDNNRKVPLKTIADTIHAIKRIVIKDDFCTIFSLFIKEVYYTYLKIDEMTSDDYNMILNLCFDFYDCCDLMREKAIGDDKKITSSWLFGIDAYHLLTLIILSSYKVSDVRIIDLLNKEMKVGNQSVLKAIIVANISYLWKLDPAWVTLNIKKLFFNEVKNQNISIFAFQFSHCIDQDFINLLCETDLIDVIIDSDDFHEHKWVFIHNLLVNIEKYQFPNRLIEVIGKSKNNFGGINSFFAEVAKINDISKIENDIELISRELSEKFICNSKSSGILIKHLLSIYPKMSNSKYLWRLIMRIADDHGTHYTKEILEEIKTANIPNPDLIEFIQKYVDSLNDHFYQIKEVKRLIDYADWTNSKNVKQSIINKIGELNPDYWSL